MLDRTSKVINIFELTCSFEKNVPVAHLKKITKYFDLKTDHTYAGWSTSTVPFEVGSRGQITNNNENTIKDMMKLVNSQSKPKKIISELSRNSLLTSFSIFQPPLPTLLGIPSTSPPLGSQPALQPCGGILHLGAPNCAIF